MAKYGERIAAVHDTYSGETFFCDETFYSENTEVNTGGKTSAADTDLVMVWAQIREKSTNHETNM